MRVRTKHPYHRLPETAAAAAFSLVEILVVIAIIGILLAIVFKGGSALVGSGKSRETSALLTKLDLAIDEYKREVDTSRIPKAKYVFNGSPPDDLRVFLGTTVIVGGCDLQLRNSGVIRQNGTLVQQTALMDARSPATGQLDPDAPLLHADIRAMVLAMRLNSPKAKAVLDSIDPKYWASQEAVNGYTFHATSDSNADPIPLDFLVDAWGTPLEYFATCICYPSAPSLTPREFVSNAFVHVNNDGGIVVSYGPNGPDQLSTDMRKSEGDTTMVADFFAEFDRNTMSGGVINHRLNSDNLYSSDFFTNRIRQAGP